MSQEMLTHPDGPVVVSARTLQALIAIRRDKLLPQLFGAVGIARSNLDTVDAMKSDPPPWLKVLRDVPDQAIPERVAGIDELDGATLRVALFVKASNVLLDGPTKDKVKLCFIKAEGALSLLVRGHQLGLVSNVQAMVKALKALGHEDVLPPPDALDALWEALERLE